MKNIILNKIFFSILMAICLIIVPTVAEASQQDLHYDMDNSDNSGDSNSISARAAFPRSIYIKEVFTSPAWETPDGGHNFYPQIGERISVYNRRQELTLDVPSSRAAELNQILSSRGHAQTGWHVKVKYEVYSEKYFYAPFSYRIDDGPLIEKSLLPGEYTFDYYIPLPENSGSRYLTSFSGSIPRANGSGSAFWGGVTYNSDIINN